ncbi:MAG: HAD family hydrolase [Solirubrobacteraceae bacterium]
MTPGDEPPAGSAQAGRESRGAAFFDLDRTLIAGSSAFQFARASYRAGMMSRGELVRGAVANLRFRLRGSTDEATQALRQRALEGLQGVRVRDVERLVPDILTGLLPKLYPKVLRVAWDHQDAGRPVYICTAASQEIADLLADVLVFDGAIGARYEAAAGVYTGRPGGPFTYREGKAEAIRELAARDGIDLAASWAYSDSESDLPMMRAVGHPVAVNPDTGLARVAREEGWEIMRFETLGRRLKIGAAALTAAAAGGVGSAVARRRGPSRTPRALVRR